MVSRLRPPEENRQIVVATEKLTLGTKISKSNVRIANWPKSIPLEGGFTEVSQVIDRGAITTIFPNEPILDAKLAPKESGAGLVSVIPDGMRAMSVKVDDVIGVAGFVLPGTHVDIILTGSPKDNEEEASRIFLENVQVVAAGQNIDVDANGKPQNVQVVTLLVTPEQAQILALSQGNGRVQLALRNQLDIEFKNPKPALRASLFYGTKPAEELPQKVVSRVPHTQPKPIQPTPIVTAPPPPIKHHVDMILGSKRETVTFTENK
jgi:pilus assembly protein CpaB